MGIYFGRTERNLKGAIKDMLDKWVEREMPDNLEETQYMEYADLELYGKMREFNTAVVEYINEYETRIKNLEDQVDELNKALLKKGVVEE